MLQRTISSELPGKRPGFGDLLFNDKGFLKVGDAEYDAITAAESFIEGALEAMMTGQERRDFEGASMVLPDHAGMSTDDYFAACMDAAGRNRKAVLSRVARRIRLTWPRPARRPLYVNVEQVAA